MFFNGNNRFNSAYDRSYGIPVTASAILFRREYAVLIPGTVNDHDFEFRKMFKELKCGQNAS